MAAHAGGRAAGKLHGVDVKRPRIDGKINLAVLEYRRDAGKMARAAAHIAVGIVDFIFVMSCVAGEAVDALLPVVRVACRILMAGEAVHVAVGHGFHGLGRNYGHGRSRRGCT